MKTYLVLFLLISTLSSSAQNTTLGIGSTTRSTFEVSGSVSKTIGLFGGQQGVSIMRNNTALGFNVFKDAATENSFGKYMASGYAGTIYLEQVIGTGGLHFNLHPSGTADAAIASGTTILRLGDGFGTAIHPDQNANARILDVSRGTGGWGTAVFEGTSFYSHINYSTAENTYIRGGKSTSNVYLNDVASQSRTLMGNGSTRVGINYSNPTATLEVRQTEGRGLTYNAGGTLWEWRVSGNPASLNLYYNNVLKSYFSPVNGAIVSVSDARLKTNIRSLPSVLTAVNQLRTVQYEMIQGNPLHVKSIGFIAQEVLNIFPNMVSVPKDDKQFLSMRYADMGIIGVKAIQEEQVLIDKLVQRADELERLMSELEQIDKNN